MKPAWFVTVEVRGGGEESFGGERVVRGVAFGHLHSVFIEYPGRFALAVPKRRSAVQVFASSREDLDILADGLLGRAWIRDYVRLSYPRAVPTDFSGQWWTYRRYRIPTLRSDRKTGGQHGELHTRRLQKVVRDGMEYFQVRSSSNGHAFTVIVEQLPGVPQVGECTPSGYGLASATNMFSLPECE
jgi:hypothetical protein